MSTTQLPLQRSRDISLKQQNVLNDRLEMIDNYFDNNIHINDCFLL